MTLDTRFRIIDPIDAREVFDLGRWLVGATDEHTWIHEPDGGQWTDTPRYRNRLGQGLDALLEVEYGADGPLPGRYEDELDDYGGRPDAAIEVSFDTAYGYRGPGGMTCGQLHANYVEALGRWCEDRRLTYAWQDEHSGTWYRDWRNAADVLGAASQEARAWLWETVMPAIESRVES